MSTWMIYGANGYTGRLCVDHALSRGLRPILAGRRATAVTPLATTHGLEHRTFALDDPAELATALDGVDLVLHCAGPFSSTSRPMLDACLRSGAHYLDITGEIAVFEAVFARDPEVRRAGVCAIPGVGFDVVPTDGLAAKLALALPSATHLELAFVGMGSTVSHGTAQTAVEGSANGSAARIGGRIVKVPTAYKTRTLTLGGKARHVVSIPWGDVSTAYHSTGIPNIVTYMGMPPSAVPWMKLSDRLGLTAVPGVKSLLSGWVSRSVTGPTAEQLEQGVGYVWGRVADADGRWVEGTLKTPETYRFTALSAVAAVERVLAGGVGPGALTPSRAFGADFVDAIPGVEVFGFSEGIGPA